MKIMIFLVARLVEFLQCLLLNKNACRNLRVAKDSKYIVKYRDTTSLVSVVRGTRWDGITWRSRGPILCTLGLSRASPLAQRACFARGLSTNFPRGLSNFPSRLLHSLSDLPSPQFNHVDPQRGTAFHLLFAKQLPKERVQKIKELSSPSLTGGDGDAFKNVLFLQPPTMGYRFNRQRQSVNIWTFSSLVGAKPSLLLSLSTG